MGTYFAGRLDLEVMFQAELVPAHVNFFNAFFQRVSEELFVATNGQMSIEHVFLMSEDIGPSCPDVEIGATYTDESGGRLWLPNSVPITYNVSSLPSVGRFVHELGHYLFALGNEFEGAANSGVDACVPRAQQQSVGACVMGIVQDNTLSAWRIADDDGFGLPLIWANWEDLLMDEFGLPVPAGTMPPPHGVGFKPGFPRLFCWIAASGSPTVHDVTEISGQNSSHPGKSCWDTLVDDSFHIGLVYGLTLPVPAPVVPSTAPLATTVVVVKPTQSFVLTLDRSGSMQGSKFDAMLSGAKFWIDLVKPREELGLVSFATTPSVDRHVAAAPPAASGLPGFRTPFHNALPTSAGGNTAIGDALRDALDEIKTRPVCASTNLLLFTDGLQTAGVETADDVLPDLVAARVRVFVIGVGLDQDKIKLAQIAAATRGEAFFIDAAPSDTDTAAMIERKLDEVALITRDKAQMLCFAPFVPGVMGFGSGGMPPPSPFPNPPSLPPPPGLPPPHIFGPTSEISVWVAEESRDLVIGVLGSSLLHTAGVEVFDPAGDEVRTLAGAHHVIGAQRYRFSVIERPRPGRWTLRAPRAQAEDFGLQAFASARQSGVRLVIEHPRRLLAVDEDVRITIRVLAPRAVAPSEVRVRRRVQGTWIDCPTQEAGDVATLGDLDARISADIAAPGFSGPMEVVVDVRRDEGFARYPVDVRCGSDRPKLTPANTKEVPVGQIVLRRTVTLLYGEVAGGGNDTGPGRAWCHAWVHPKQDKLVRDWFRRRKRRKGGFSHGSGGASGGASGSGG